MSLTGMNLTTLPLELLLHIISHLSEVDIWRVRCVSKVLYCLAVEQHFKHVTLQLDSSPDFQQIQHLKLLNTPTVANRVRELVLLPPGRAKTISRNTQHGLAHFRINRLLNNLISHKKTFLSFAKKLTAIVSLNVQFIDNCNLDVLTWRSLITQTILQNSFHEIRKLDLTVSLECISMYLPPPGLVLPQLEDVTIRLISVLSSKHASLSNTSIRDSLVHTVSPFIHRHSSTLRILDFDLPDIWKLRFEDEISTLTIDVGLLLQDMPPIPKLLSLSIFIGQCTNMINVRNFLNRNVSTLRELTIVSRWFNYSRLLVPRIFLPLQTPDIQLKKLTIKYEGLPPLTTEQTNDFMSLIQYQPLVSLRIFGNVQTPQAASCFIDTISGYPEKWTRLRSLRLSLQELTPYTLDAFTTYLTDLCDLVLSTQRWKRRPTENETLKAVFGGEYEFALEMSRRSYPHWNLQYLTITSPSWAPGNAKRSKSCLVAVALAIPSLQSLNNVGRTEFISEAKDSIIKNTDEQHFPWG